MSSSEPGEAGAVIELWQAPDRLWRWRYVEPSSDGRVLAFLSNKEYESRDLALRSATTAYPEVTVRDAGVTAVGSRLARGDWTAKRQVAADAAGRRRVQPRDLLTVLGLVALAVVLLWSRRRCSRRSPRVADPSGPPG
jgi:hypothetical protein